MYGMLEDLCGFVDVCYFYGIVVLFDVVYNYLGFEGNYLVDFGFYFL